MKVIDLFCGAGGFSEGFKQAGHDIVLAVDLWHVALETHRLNHPNCAHWLRNMMDIGLNELPDADVLIGSPPCQSFSVANLHTRKMDTSLIDKFMSIALSGKYKYWCWENVPASYTTYFSNGFSYNIVDCADYGTPSHRKRKFCCNFTFPKPTHIGKHITIGEALHNLEPGEGLPPSPDPNFINKPNVLQWLETHPRQKMSDVMNTITTRTARSKKIQHPLHDRPYTVAEVRRFMGFPDSYELPACSLSDKYTLYGNAVPPPMARKIAEVLI